jgi:hypothetical protein
MSRFACLAALAGCSTLPVTIDELPGPSCDAIRADLGDDYAALLEANQACDETADCHAPFGACELGLGGCQEAVSVNLTEEALDVFRADASKELEDADCEATTVACDCYGGYDADCVNRVCTLIYVGYN